MKVSARLRAGEGAKIDRRTTTERELSLVEAKQEYVADALAFVDKANLRPPSLDFLRAHHSKHGG